MIPLPFNWQRNCSPVWQTVSSSLRKGMIFQKKIINSTKCFGKTGELHTVHVVLKQNLMSFVPLPFMPHWQNGQTATGCVITWRNNETFSLIITSEKRPSWGITCYVILMPRDAACCRTDFSSKGHASSVSPHFIVSFTGVEVWCERWPT